MSLPHIPEVRASKFYDLLARSAGTKRIPLAGSIELTERCNLNCVHCYINAPASDEQRAKKEFSRDEFADLLDQMASEGCLWLLFTGGEPLLRPDFLDIYDEAVTKGFLVTLFTNGTLVSKRIADRLAEHPPVSIEITCYGRTPTTYDTITRHRGSYGSFVNGLELLLERGLAVKLKTMVMTLNRHELQGMKSYAQERGLSFRFDPILNLRLDGGKEPAKFRISPEEVVALDVADNERMAGWLEFCAKYESASRRRPFLYECDAGLRNFHIDAYGGLTACIMSRTPRYDLRSGTFAEGWNHFMPAVRAQTKSRHVSCRYCDLGNLCGQCPGTAMVDTGDQEEPVEYLCEIAHLRAEKFGFKTRKEIKGNAAGKGTAGSD